jgi:pseudouridine synthase
MGLTMVKERLQKLLSRAGVGSRRACEELILNGRVSVNGMVVDSMPVIIDTDRDRVMLDGEKINVAAEQKVYFLMNKPKGVLCTAKDELDRQTVINLLPREIIRERVFPVGRLDKESQGLVLLTNDGELTKKLTHARYEIERVYHAEVAGLVDGSVVEKLKAGIWLAEGQARVTRVKIIHRGFKRSIIEVTLREGKNRQVRRMLAKLGLPVKKLVHVQMGPLVLKGVGVGRTRRLTSGEISRLKASVK